MAKSAEEEQAKRKKIVAIINPVSCPFGIDIMKANLSRALERRQTEAEFFETCATETAQTIAQAAVERGVDLILAIGGDGTVMESINAVIGKQIPVGIVPAGTGNLLAANLDIPTSLDSAIDIALTGDILEIDLVAVNGGENYFAIMGGLGYDAMIMRETPREAKRYIGKLAYAWTGLKSLRGHRFGVELILDDRQTILARAKCVLIANMGMVAKGVKLFPEASPEDGKMEIGILKAYNWRAFLETIWHTLRGKPAASPYFDRYTAHKISVRARRAAPFELDGEDLGDRMELIAEIVPKAARVMVPKRNADGG